MVESFCNNGRKLWYTWTKAFQKSASFIKYIYNLYILLRLYYYVYYYINVYNIIRITLN